MGDTIEPGFSFQTAVRDTPDNAGTCPDQPVPEIIRRVAFRSESFDPAGNHDDGTLDASASAVLLHQDEFPDGRECTGPELIEVYPARQM